MCSNWTWKDIEMGKKVYQLSFSTEGTFGAAVVCNDPYFTVTLKMGKIANGKALFQVPQNMPTSSCMKTGRPVWVSLPVEGNGGIFLIRIFRWISATSEEKPLYYDKWGRSDERPCVKGEGDLLFVFSPARRASQIRCSVIWLPCSMQRQWKRVVGHL